MMKNMINKLNISTVAIFLPVMLFIFDSLSAARFSNNLELIKKVVPLSQQEITIVSNNDTYESKIDTFEFDFHHLQLLRQGICSTSKTEKQKDVNNYYGNWVFSYAKQFTDLCTKILSSKNNQNLENIIYILKHGILQCPTSVQNDQITVNVSDCRIFDITTVTVTDNDILNQFATALNALHENIIKSNQNVAYIVRLTGEIMVYYLESALETIQFRSQYEASMDKILALIRKKRNNNIVDESIYLDLVKNYLILGGVPIDSINRENLELTVQQRIDQLKKNYSKLSRKEPILNTTCSKKIEMKGGLPIFLGISCFGLLMKAFEYTKTIGGGVVDAYGSVSKQNARHLTKQYVITPANNLIQTIKPVVQGIVTSGKQTVSSVMQKAGETGRKVRAITTGADKGLFGTVKDWWNEKWNPKNKK